MSSTEVTLKLLPYSDGSGCRFEVRVTTEGQWPIYVSDNGSGGLMFESMEHWLEVSAAVMMAFGWVSAAKEGTR